MSTIRLAFLPRTGADWRTVQLTGSKGADRTILVIPGEHALVRWIDAPGKTPQQIRAAALAQLAPELAQPPEDCITALGDAHEGKRQVAIMSRAVAETVLNEAKAHGVKPSAIIPDTCLLAAPLESDAVTVPVDTGDILVRTAQQAYVVQPDLFATLAGNISHTETTLETEAARTLRNPNLNPPDFLAAMPTARTPTGDNGPASRIPWAMAAALILAIAAPWANAVRLDMSARAMDREASQIAADALPNASQIRNARAQLSAALLAHTHGRQRIETAAVVLGELTALPDIAISRLDANTDTPVVMANLTAPSPASADPLRARLAARNYTAEQTVSDAPGGATAIDLTVRPNP